MRETWERFLLPVCCLIHRPMHIATSPPHSLATFSSGSTLTPCPASGCASKAPTFSTRASTIQSSARKGLTPCREGLDALSTWDWWAVSRLEPPYSLERMQSLKLEEKRALGPGAAGGL